MSERLRDLFAELPVYLGGHMLLSLAALLVGLIVSLPLGVFASRRPRLAEVVLGIANILQTIPSLALLALMVPLLGGMIGFWPAFVAMTLYSLLPILAGTITGLKSIDPALIEAARSLGMSERQMFLGVQLPLAAPVILSGIRVATVIVVGTATLATPVGEATLGNYIFAGLNTRDHLATVFGCVCAALLAILLDQLIRLLEVATRRRSPILLWTGGLALAVVITGSLYRPLAQFFAPPENPAVVGSADYTEQHILSEVMRGTLEEAGFQVDQRKGMGETIEFESLCSGSIDCYVDYTGNIWTTLMKRPEPVDRTKTLDEVTRYLKDEHGVVCLGPLGFENAYALAMKRADAKRYKIRTIQDLAKHSARWKIAGDLQFFHRPEWQRVRKMYSLTFAATKPMDPTLMYPAIDSKSVEVICAYTSDGRIKSSDLVVLDDPLQAFPPYDAILLLSPQAAKKPGLVAALKPLIGAIDIDRMRRANGRVDVDGLRPGKAAEELLEQLSGRSGR